MNGARAVLEVLARNGVTTCFTNPGTTELAFVNSFHEVPSVRPVLCLQELVATGAADGYFRTTGNLSSVLLHLGPGLMNGAAFLHDARRGQVPLVAVVGDHATWHLEVDPPLASDIASLAAACAVGMVAVTSVGDLVAEVDRACAMARQRRGPVVLTVPADLQEALVVDPLPEFERTREGSPHVDEGTLATVGDLLRSDGDLLFILGSATASPAGQLATWELANAFSKRVVLEGFPTRLERGEGLPAIRKLPYLPESIRKVLPQGGAVVLLGTREPVSFFGYAGIPSRLIDPASEVVVLGDEGDDLTEVVHTLQRMLGAQESAELTSRVDPEVVEYDSSANLDPGTVSALVAQHISTGSVLVDEGRTSTGPFFDLSANSARHLHLGHTGGAIGEGMPLALGASAARQGTEIVVLQADGGGMYAPQALWTMSREKMLVTVIVLKNNAYGILDVEMARAGYSRDGVAGTLTSLREPSIDWIALAGAFGVSAVAATTVGELSTALANRRSSILTSTASGPFLIEVSL